jgi:hypothetical protein
MFSNTNTAQNPTFNVNSTGAKNVYYGSSQITTSSLNYAGYKDRPMTFMYDGTQYRFMCWGYDSNTTYSPHSLGFGYGTCSTAEATVEKAVTLSSYALVKNGIVAVKFTYAVPASATLNINSKGAKAIYYRGAAITANVIKAGDTATFIYNGSQYHLLGIDYASKTAASGGTELSLVTTGEKYTWNNKQNAITSSNKLAASNVSGLATVATSGSYNDLSNKPNIPSGAAASKGVDTSIAASSTSTNLPTSKAVAAFVEGKGYKTTDNNTDAIYSGIAYCSTAAGTAAKVGVMPKFALASGQYILLRTTATNSATSSVTLNVNSTGAKPVKIGNSSTAPTASNFPAGDYLANYDGTNWILTRIYLTDNNTTDYNSLSNKPTIPTVNNATITIAAGSGLTTGGDFTTNQSSAETITLNVGAGTGITVNADNIAVKYGTEAGTACQGNDSRLSNSRTPTAHASTATTYGAGTSSNYGHVKLSDSTSSTSAASAGIAASPKAVKAAYDKAVEAYNLASSGSFTYGTEDLVAGASALTTGTLYFVYE